MTEREKTRIPSDVLRQKIKECIGAFGTTRQKILEAFEIGRKEGFTDMEIGNLVRQAYYASGFKSHGFLEMLPSGAKRKRFVNEGSSRNNNESESSYKKRMREREWNAKRRLEIKNLKPSEYKSTELSRYTKPFLIEIVQWYEEKEAILQRKQAEVQALLQPINKRRMVSTDGGPSIK